MSINKNSCPSCGATINVDNDITFCPYCGTKFDIEQKITINKNLSVHKKYTDDADIIRAQNERLKIETNDKSRKRAPFVFIGIIIAIVIITISIIGVVHYLEEKRVNDALSQGKIRVSYYYENFEGEKYQAVKAQLEAIGFTNFVLIDLGEDGFLWSNTDKVKSVSIAGNSSFKSDDFFFPDDKIIITYY